MDSDEEIWEYSSKTRKVSNLDDLSKKDKKTKVSSIIAQARHQEKRTGGSKRNNSKQVKLRNGIIKEETDLDPEETHSDNVKKGKTEKHSEPNSLPGASCRDASQNQSTESRSVAATYPVFDSVGTKISSTNVLDVNKHVTVSLISGLAKESKDLIQRNENKTEESAHASVDCNDSPKSPPSKRLRLSYPENTSKLKVKEPIKSTDKRAGGRLTRGKINKKEITRTKNERTVTTPIKQCTESHSHSATAGKSEKGHCPFCQMPFSCLLLESPRCHAMECMDVPITSAKECPAGAACDSTIPSHYRKYRHTYMAEVRAGMRTSERERENDDVIECKHEPSDKKVEDNVPQMSPTLNSQRPSTEKDSPNCSLGNSTVTSKTSPYFQRGSQASVKASSVRRRLMPNSQASQATSSTDKDLCASYHVLLPNENSAVLDESTHAKSNKNIFGNCESDLELSRNETTTDNEICDKSSPKESISETLSAEQSANNMDTMESVQNDDGSAIPGSPKSSPPETMSDEQSANTLDTVEGSQNDDAFSDDDDDLLLIAADSLHEGKLEGEPSARENKGINIISNTEHYKPGTKQTSIQSFFKSKFPPSKPKTQASVSSSVSTSGVGHWQLKRARTSKGGAGNPSTESHGSSGSGGSRYEAKRQCPFYKKMPDTPFTVDAFRYGSVPGCQAYFLTHFHYDHYGGLTRKFRHPIYCSKVTGNLVEKQLKVDPQFINRLPMDTPRQVEGVEGTFMEANHCPGSVIILFKLKNGQVYLHTGDFRASVDMEEYPPLQGISINRLYLDTTYCDPAYAFPAQKDVISFAVHKVEEVTYQSPNTLIVVGSYTIGKERIFRAIAEELNARVCVTREKLRVLECLEDVTLSKRLTVQPLEARVHVLPMRQLNYQSLSEYLNKLKPRFDRLLAFEPTGWTHGGGTRHTSLDKLRPKLQREGITIYGVPYSEHSSYTEMKRFCQVLRPTQILATVNNGNPVERRKMEKLFEEWMKEAIQSPSKTFKQTELKKWFH